MNLFRKRGKQIVSKISAILFCMLFLPGIMVYAWVVNEHCDLTDSGIKYYTSVEICEGDSLWSLCNRYISDEYHSESEYIQEVKALNHLSGDCIHIGSYLVMPYYSQDIKELSKL